MQSEQDLLTRIKNLQALAIDLLHSKALVLEKYSEPFNQDLQLSIEGLEGLKDVYENVLGDKVKYKETSDYANQPYIVFRGFEFMVRI